MNNRKGCVMGTSIHKEKYKEAEDSSPAKFLGGGAGMLGKILNPAQMLPGKAGQFFGRLPGSNL